MLWLNERVVSTDAVVRAMVPKSKMALARTRLGPEFHVLNSDGVIQTVSLRRRDSPVGLADRATGMAYWAAEFDSHQLAPGSYQVIASLDDTTDQGTRDFLILDDSQFTELVQKATQESFVEDATAEVLGATQCWDSAWQLALDYVGAPRRFDYIRVTHNANFRESITKGGKLGGAIIESLPKVSYDFVHWAAFHANRFLLDQLFYGGIIKELSQWEVKSLTLQVEITARYPVAPELPRGLRDLLASAKASVYRLDASWIHALNKGKLYLRWTQSA